MKLAIVVSTHDTEFSALAFKSNLRKDIETVAELGYDGVELAIRNPADVSADEILELTEKYGLQVVALGTGQAYGQEGLSFAHPDQSVRGQAVQRIKQHVCLAEKLNAQVIIGLLRGKVEAGQDRAKCVGWMKDCFRECLAFACDKNVGLLVEPLNRYESNLINTCAEAVELIDELGFSNLKILIDSFHMNIEEASIEKSVKDCASYIGHVHVADSNRWAPGLGHFDFERLVAILNSVNYDRYLSAEIIPMPNADVAVRQALSCLQPLIVS